MRSKADNRFWMVFFLCDLRPYYYTAHLLRVSPPPQPLRSVSGSSLSFSSPPPLNSVNRLSIRVLYRISFTLENFSQLSLSGKKMAGGI